MQVNLNRPRIDDAGRLTDADMLTGARLEKVRRTNPGAIWMPPQHQLLSCPPCNGDCANGRQCPKRAQSFPSAGWQHTVPVLHDACAPEGGKHAEPAPTKTRRDVTGARIGAVILLVSAVTVIGVVSAAVMARWPLF